MNASTNMMVANLVKVMEDLNRPAPLEEIYQQYEVITEKKLSQQQKTILKVIMEMYSSNSARYSGQADIFYICENNEWMLRKNVVSNRKSVKKTIKTLSPEQKLLKRIKREVTKVKYLGDINIDDEEYKILIKRLKTVALSVTLTSAKKNDLLFAVALVQVGIRYYNGRYWPHISDILDMKIDGNKQRLLGDRFHYTLKVNNKLVGEPNAIVNNILMHCYVTNHYATDLFEFLFAYYQKDLNRDLEQHTKEMREHLMNSMKKAEDSTRAYKIKRGTADAVTANENGCKIRVRHVLKWMDEYLFNDILPENSSNRIAKLFVKWAKNSASFDFEKHGITRNGKKRNKVFRYPYLNFDTKNGYFYLVLPVQTIPLSNDEEIVEISWRISYGNHIVSLNTDIESTVVGCRTMNIEKIHVNSSDVFSRFKIDLIKNDKDVVKSFTIFEDEIRFFDEDFNILHDNNLHEGTTYAFVSKGQKIETSCESYIDEYDGLKLYTLNVETGDVVKKPSGKAIVVGENLSEGIVKNSAFIEGCYAVCNDLQYDVFNKIPNILFATKQKAENGTLIFVNNQKYKFDKNKCVEFKQNESEINWYLLNLNELCSSDGVYEVRIDVPNDKKSRRYSFALIKDFSFSFIDAPYVFVKKGLVTLPIGFDAIDNLSQKINETNFEFILSSKTNSLEFISNSGIKISLVVPILKWKNKLDDDWEIAPLYEIWHKELPDYFYFSYIGKNLELCSKYIDIDSESDTNICGQLDKDTGVVTIETRKVKSWLEMGPLQHQLYLRNNDFECELISIITRSVLVNCDLQSDVETGELIVKSTILGFADCVIDVFCDGEQIANKVEMKAIETKIKSSKLFGDFELIVYEIDDDEDDFDFGVETFSVLAKKRFRLINQNDLSGCSVKVEFITQTSNEKSVFAPTRYYIKDFVIKNILWDDEENMYIGTSFSALKHLNGLRVAIEIPNKKHMERAILSFYSEEENCFIDFLYDNVYKHLVTEEDTSLSVNEANKRYVVAYGDKYYHITIRKKGD